ncbi:hypothetical protein SNOG_20123 [Parastagonospora nodorum SN15]|uniref:Uncharacterized protein n=1 Tax=Phaeosphaeria nodorum (strain SN15 / ATCC MYA-4574 / FGSC 10173) TaxID=321614 RepID=A9JXB9_PHANO|nr:hypothetical protein SNOG_20123 [Parastagonospora nodorum SN15]EDP89809.1 hypothetical protein SNOG_20123 [Parastagonospora nodorum SN15]
MVVKAWSSTNFEVLFSRLSVPQQNICNVLPFRRENAIVKVADEAAIWSVVTHFW